MTLERNVEKLQSPSMIKIIIRIEILERKVKNWLDELWEESTGGINRLEGFI